MYVVAVPNRNSPPAILLRESYREDGKVKNRTLANLSSWPATQVESLRQVLKGNTTVGPPLEDAFEIVRSRPHGHVAAVLGTIRKLGLDSLLSSAPSREQKLVLAMVVSRIVEPLSKLATARCLNSETLSNTLGELLGLQAADPD